VLRNLLILYLFLFSPGGPNLQDKAQVPKVLPCMLPNDVTEV